MTPVALWRSAGQDTKQLERRVCRDPHHCAAPERRAEEFLWHSEPATQPELWLEVPERLELVQHSSARTPAEKR